MKSGWIVVFICLIVSGVAAFGLSRIYRDDLAQTQDLATGMLYFLESSGGRFPGSQAEFLASDFVEELPDGVIRIKPRPTSTYRQQTHGVSIPNLEPFAIQWGADLGAVSVDGSKVLDPNGQEIRLMRWPSSPNSGREYTRMLLSASLAIRAKAANASESPPLTADRREASQPVASSPAFP